MSIKIRIECNSGSELSVQVLLALMAQRVMILDVLAKQEKILIDNPPKVDFLFDSIYGGVEYGWNVDICVNGYRYEVYGHQDSDIARYLHNILRPLFLASGSTQYADHCEQYLYCTESGSSMPLDCAYSVNNGEGDAEDGSESDDAVSSTTEIF